MIGLPMDHIWQEPLPAPPTALYSEAPFVQIPRDTPVPLLVPNGPAPTIAALGAVVVDMETGVLLLDHHGDHRLPIASLTKIMTALVAMEAYELSDIITVTPAMREVEGTRMWLFGDERISVDHLVQGALIASGNDAAQALAFAMGHDDFIQAMNTKATLLGLHGTRFAGAIGFDHSNTYSTPRDIALLTKYALSSSYFRTVVAKESATLTSDSGIRRTVDTTHRLLGTSTSIIGIKTGTTPMAMECLITLARLPNGREVLVVILGSTDRYHDTRQLLEWVGVAL